MIPLALVDTNVVVSGVLAGAGTSPTRSILDAMLAGAIRFVLSEALLTEYRRVLLRPSIRERHQLTEVDVDAILEELVLNAGLREPPVGEAPWPVVPGDEHVLALLAASPEAVLVTGDRQPARGCRLVVRCASAGGVRGVPVLNGGAECASPRRWRFWLPQPLPTTPM